MHTVFLSLKLASAKMRKPMPRASSLVSCARLTGARVDVTATLVLPASVIVVRAESVEVGHGAWLSATAQLFLVRALPLAVAHRSRWTCEQQHIDETPARGEIPPVQLCSVALLQIPCRRHLEFHAVHSALLEGKSFLSRSGFCAAARDCHRAKRCTTLGAAPSPDKHGTWDAMASATMRHIERTRMLSQNGADAQLI